MVAEKGKLIVFRLDASHERGMGHLYRMKTLADEFRENGFDCLSLLRNNEVAASILNKTPYKHLFYPPDYSEEEIVDKYFLEHPKPDLWIFDILTTESEWVVRVKRNNVPVVCFDDLKGGLDAADLVIKPISWCWESSKSPANPHAHVLSGPQYAIINPRILGVRKRNRLPKGAIRVAVTMGGSDTHGATVKVARALSEIEEELEVTFFLGPHFLHEKELSEITHKLSFPCLMKNAVPDLHKELIESDVAICGGGQTLFELCAIGMPVLALANEAHEEKTISYFFGHGACIGIGSIHKTIDTGRIRTFFKKVRSEPEEVHLMSSNAQRLVDGKGTSRCYNECIKIIIKGRGYV